MAKMTPELLVFSEVQRCLAGHDLWVFTGGFRWLLICRDFFSVFDWNCYQQTTISRNEAFHFNVMNLILKVMLTSNMKIHETHAWISHGFSLNAGWVGFSLHG